MMRAISKDISTHRSDSKLRPSGEGMRDHMIASTYAGFVMRGAKARQPVPAIPQSDSRRDRRFGSLRGCARKKKSRARAARFVRSAARRTVSGFAELRDRGSRRCCKLAVPTAPLDISPPSAGAPSPPPLERPVFQFGPFGRHIKCETKLFA